MEKGALPGLSAALYAHLLGWGCTSPAQWAWTHTHKALQRRSTRALERSAHSNSIDKATGSVAAHNVRVEGPTGMREAAAGGFACAARELTWP